MFIDNIEDIEENPDTAQILSSFEGRCCHQRKSEQALTSRVP